MIIKEKTGVFIIAGICFFVFIFTQYQYLSFNEGKIKEEINKQIDFVLNSSQKAFPEVSKNLFSPLVKEEIKPAVEEKPPAVELPPITMPAVEELTPEEKARREKQQRYEAYRNQIREYKIIGFSKSSDKDQVILSKSSCFYFAVENDKIEDKFYVKKINTREKITIGLIEDKEFEVGILFDDK